MGELIYVPMYLLHNTNFIIVCSLIKEILLCSDRKLPLKHFNRKKRILGFHNWGLELELDELFEWLLTMYMLYIL